MCSCDAVTGGTFSGTDLACTLVTCPALDGNRQPGYTFPSSGSLNYGADRAAECAHGYTGVASNITCTGSGTWSLATGCDIITCPSVVSHTGYIIDSGGDAFYLSTRNYTCDIGYEASPGHPGSGVVECRANATWSSPIGCTLVTCDSPIPPTGYSYEAAGAGAGGYTYGQTAELGCAQGYEGPASVFVSCQVCIYICPRTPSLSLSFSFTQFINIYIYIYTYHARVYF